MPFRLADFIHASELCEKVHAVKICFFIWGLRAAGAERVMTFLANAWAARGWEVTILTMEDGQEEPFYSLHPFIRLCPLNLLKDSTSIISGLINNANRVRALRGAIKDARPDVVISFIDTANILAVLATRGLRIPVAISERTDPSRRSLGRIWNALRDFAYPLSDVIVFQSKEVMEWFPEIVRKRGVVIPNPVPIPPLGTAPQRSSDSPQGIVTLGRLASVKGFDLLLIAFAEASSRVPGWSLDIWGEGPERESLQRMADALGLSERVRLRGVTSKPFEVLRNADLFVLSSRAEGFPNALVEAMACGLPVLSTDFGGAARDIIQDGVNGMLVPPEDPTALAEALVRLMSDRDERARLAARAPEVVQRFSSEHVLGLWEGALDRIVGSKTRPASIGDDACQT